MTTSLFLLCRRERLLAFLFIFGLLLTTEAQGPGQQVQQPPPQIHKRFEYKYSFKPPYLAQKDGTVPFFEYSGNAIASEESVRITPSLRSQKGAIWSKLASTFDWWEVEVHFRVTGRGRIGADGLAFWFTSTKGFEGPVFGSSDKWNGLGIFFDSFDNDNKHNNPYIMSMLNDGNKVYDHQHDGSTQQLAGCLRDFRNKPFPVKARIEYFRNVLTVSFHNGMSNNDKDFEMCFRVDNVILPKAGYFGISAATGGLADDHDVIKFSTYSLRSPEMALVPDNANEVESKKFELEFEEYQKKLKQQKDDWAKQNPEQANKVKSEDDWDNWFTDQDKELQQIFQGQSQIRDIVTELHRKMDDIVARQDRSLQVLSAIQSGGAVAPQPGGQVPPPQGNIPIDTIRRDEVNAILANQREIVTASRDIKNFVSDIHGKTGQILSRGVGTAQQIGSGADLEGTMRDVKENLNILKRDVNIAIQRMASQGAPSCPPIPEVSCVSTTFFVILLAAQMVVLIIVLVFRDSKKDQAKKYY